MSQMVRRIGSTSGIIRHYSTKSMAYPDLMEGLLGQRVGLEDFSGNQCSRGVDHSVIHLEGGEIITPMGC